VPVTKPRSPSKVTKPIDARPQRAQVPAIIVSSTMFITAVVVFVTVITVLKRKMVAATASAPSLVKKK